MSKAFFLILAVVLAGSSAVFAQAGRTYELKYALREGQSWTFDQVNEGMQSTNMSAEGQPPFQGQQTMRQIRKGTITVLSVANGVPSSVKVTFDQACVTKMKAQGQEQTINFPFAGATVTITRGADGQISNDFKGDADPMAAMELANYITGANNPFPKKPVAVDEQWEPDVANARRMYQLGEQDKIVAVNKLVSITEVAGRPAAEVIGYISITKKADGMEMTNTMKGQLWYDLETGNTLASSIDGTSNAKGVQQMNGPNGQPMQVNVVNDGKTQFRSETKIVDMGKGGNAVVPPRNPVNPINPVNPPAAGGGAAGVYRSDDLSIELIGGGGQYTGTLTKGGQSFPVTAEDVAGGIKGRFKVGQDSFDFTMTIGNDSATLSSGTAEFKLKKQGARPVNPLDNGAAKPVNPLGVIIPGL